MRYYFFLEIILMQYDLIYYYEQLHTTLYLMNQLAGLGDKSTLLGSDLF